MFLLNHPILRLLFAAQALYWSCSIIGITLTSLAGLRLAPWTVLPLCRWRCWCWATCWR